MTKKELRDSVSSDVNQFLASGGTVVTCRTVKRKIKHPASGHQKTVFFEKQPPKRAHSSWMLIDGRF